MLIVMCVYATEANGKLKYVRECLASLAETVDFEKHRAIIVNQASCAEAADWLRAWQPEGVQIIHLSKNIGTARGVNMGLIQRGNGEVCCKTDDDVTWGVIGWADEMERVLRERPEIGILGLKRDDVYGVMAKDGEVLYCDDIMGTCTAYSPALMDKIGGLAQFSCYGYDDSLYSVRSLAAGFRNAFLPAIPIVHLDEGGTEYTDWKINEAGLHLQHVSILMNMIRNGEKGYWYGWE